MSSTTTTTTTTQAPPESRVLRCKVCQRYTAHVYIGRQEFPGKAFHLYNCVKCSSTVAQPIEGAET